MKGLTLVLVVLLAACSGAATGSMTGESTPEAATTAFINAAKAQDLQAMTAVWGTSRGSVRETRSRSENERLAIIVAQLLCQDQFRIVGKAPGVDGRQLVRVELQKGASTLPRRVTTVQGPGQRWYVEDFEMDASIQQFCR